MERTGVGSDYEIESDFIEDGQEKVLKVSRYLLEVKSTSEDYVRMTMRQGEEAVNIEDMDRYVLCIVEVSLSEVDETVVRNNSRFVFSIGTLLQDKLQDAKDLKEMEEVLGPSHAGDVEIQIEGSKIRFKIGKQVWREHGMTFDEFIEKIRTI